MVKIRQQLQAHNTRTTSPNGPTYRGIYGTMRTIVVQEGIRGLWKGNIPAEILYMGYGPVQFVALKEFTLLIDRESPRMHNDIKNALAGGAAGATATIATYPLDLLRTRFAAQGSHKVGFYCCSCGRSLTPSRSTPPFSTRSSTSTRTRASRASTAVSAPA